jgi:hypothetical protein
METLSRKLSRMDNAAHFYMARFPLRAAAVRRHLRRFNALSVIYPGTVEAAVDTFVAKLYREEEV